MEVKWLLGFYGVNGDEDFAIKDEFYEKLNNDFVKIETIRDVVLGIQRPTIKIK